MVKIFDGHNDVLLRLWKGGAANACATFEHAQKGHIDLEKARSGGFAGGLFAMFAPPQGSFAMPDFNPPYDVPLPEMLGQEPALRMMAEQAGILRQLDRAGLVRIATTRAGIASAMQEGKVAAVLHMEGAEPIDPDLQVLDLFYAAGLRSLGPVWSRPTIFGHGVPFRYPSDADTGPGLTDAGKALARRCHDLGIVFDTSHLTMAGFWDVGDLGLPLVATHSNAHAVSPGARNLTDDQLRAIGETGGMVGLNFGTCFLSPEGRADPAVPLTVAIRHLEHMIAMAGEDHVGLGSDFDGASLPRDLASAADLPNLVTAMRQAGFGDALIEKLCNRNWLRFLGRVLDKDA